MFPGLSSEIPARGGEAAHAQSAADFPRAGIENPARENARGSCAHLRISMRPKVFSPQWLVMEQPARTT